MSLSFTVVINTLDRAEALLTALASLRYQRHAAFEVVVVNGPSKDETAAVLAMFPDVRVGACPAANLSMSRNIGIAMSAGDVVAFMDDDATPEPDWLVELERAFLDPGVGGAGGAIRDHTGVRYQARVLVCDRFGWSEGFETMEEARPDGPGGRPLRYFSPTGANVAFRREALIEIGGFDETFVYFLDETDVSLRMLEAGWKLAYRPCAEVHHKYAPSALRDARRTPHSLRHPARSTAYFCRRHAAPVHGDAAALDYVHAYKKLMRRDVDDFFAERRIEAEKRARLRAEIDEGAEEGWALGSGDPVLLTRDALRPQRFVAFAQRLRAHERLRVAMVSRQYPPDQSDGIGIWTRAAAEGLAARGHEVTVVAQGPVPTVDFLNGVWLHRVPDVARGKYQPSLDLPEGALARAEAVYDEIARVRVLRGLDLVSAPIWDLEGALVRERSGLPTLLSLHTSYGLAAPHKPDWLADAAFRRDVLEPMIRAERAALGASPVLLANSEGVLDALASWAPDLNLRDRAVVLAHGLPDRAGALAPREGESVRLLFVGRLEARKGIDTLLEALPDVLNARPHAYAEIIGADAKEGGRAHADVFFAAHAGAPWLDRIQFRGEVSQATLDDAFRAADLFVAPSRFESFGLVFVEAMMFALPCIGSNVGGIGEVVGEDGVSGLLVPAGDALALKHAMLTLIDDPVRRRTMATAARARYLRHFGATAMIDGLETLMREVTVRT